MGPPARVSVVTVGSPQTVTISANGSATADLTDTYTQVPGSLDGDEGPLPAPRRAARARSPSP